MIDGLQPYSEYKESGLPWLRRCPSHWVIKRGKSYMTCVDQRSKAGKEELLTVSSARGVVPRNTAKVTMFKAASYAGYKLCWPDDLVINSLWAWGGGLGVTSRHGIISTAYSVYRARPSAQVVPRFLHELVRSSAFNWELQVRSKGIWISRLQLTDTAFLDAPIPLPPPNEQAAIVRFLDHANRKIDGFIQAKRKLIGLLNEQKQGIIHRAVTRGLDPDATLKPSGIPWLGDIPQHWEQHALCRLSKLRVERNPGGLPLLSVFLDRGVIRYEEGGGQVHAPSLDLSNYQVVRVGDFVLNNQQAWRGSVGVSVHEGIISPAYIVLEMSPQLDPTFANYLTRSRAMVDQFVAASKGVGDIQRQVFWPFLRIVQVPVPPFEEQRAIVDFLTRDTKALSHAIARTEREIALMQEYRMRLTADVVTGKLDVRAAAAKLPDLTQEQPETEPEEAEAADFEEAGA
jgi:type I restriction enzyme S subunit